MTYDWKKKNVFITGASGFLGSHLSEALASHGANVIGLIRDDVPNAYFVQQGIDQKITTIHGDVRDGYLMERVLNEYEIHMCFHVAAQPLVGTANRSPRSTFESNMTGTWNVLEAARLTLSHTMLEGVVVASSDKAYGDSDRLPYREDQPLAGKNPYDLSKTATDLLAQSYYHTYQLPITISRCGNFFGPGDLNWSRIVPGTFRWLLNKERPVLRSDGTLIRDYFFIKDVVSAYISLAENIHRPEVVGQAFNFGTEEKYTVLELVEMMRKIADCMDIEPEILGINRNEIPAQYLNCEKARTILHWKPQYTIYQGLEESYAWYKEFLTAEQRAA
ncbi:MAG: GDP-mannose 4,6-dehydratase [Candidatus Kerfeldbacteria bacterium]|nr:GDP-mannose 4,6-dehydratase [Candidatus Kerfeldbacteria bacterium]